MAPIAAMKKTTSAMRRPGSYEGRPLGAARSSQWCGMWHKLAIVVVAFAAVTGLAELLGATNLGTAMTFGEIAFIGACTTLMAHPRS
jgi:hypothetical protein